MKKYEIITNYYIPFGPTVGYIAVFTNGKYKACLNRREPWMESDNYDDVVKAVKSRGYSLGRNGNLPYSQLNEYKTRKGFGVIFGIDLNDYETNRDVRFGNNRDYTICGSPCSCQDVFLDGKVIGILRERLEKNYLNPTTHRFIVFLKEGVVLNDPHFVEDEENMMSFSNIEDMIEFYENNKDKILI